MGVLGATIKNEGALAGEAPGGPAGGVLSGSYPNPGFAIPITLGSGDAQQIFTATTAQELAIAIGTAAAPDTTLNPLAKIVRLIDLASATGDGGEQAAAFLAIGVGASGNTVQAVGGRFGAISNTGATADASAIYGTGISSVSAHVGIGTTSVGRAAVAGALASGAQISCFNGTGSDVAVNASGFTSIGALWITAAGSNKSGVAVEIGNPNTIQFDVGLHFNSQGSGGPIVTASIQDDSSSATALLIKGSHATAALQINAGVGHIGLGLAAVSGIYIVAQSDNDANPAVDFRRHSATQSGDIFRVSNDTGATQYLRVGPSGNVVFAGPLTISTPVVRTDGGTDSHNSTAVTTPTLGAAAQLAQTATDAMLYIEITTAGNLSVKIGSSISVTTTIINSITTPIGVIVAIRLPAGWFISVTTTNTAAWTTTAVTC